MVREELTLVREEVEDVSKDVNGGVSMFLESREGLPKIFLMGVPGERDKEVGEREFDE